MPASTRASTTISADQTPTATPTHLTSNPTGAPILAGQPTEPVGHQDARVMPIDDAPDTGSVPPVDSVSDDDGGEQGRNGKGKGEGKGKGKGKAKGKGKGKAKGKARVKGGVKGKGKDHEGSVGGDDNSDEDEVEEGSTRAPPTKWDTASDETLLAHLEECRAAGQQSDGGWKGVVWTAAVEKLAGSEKHSGGRPKDAESAKNRFAAMKKDYHQIKELRELSGFGWDSEKLMVTAHPESVWTDYAKAHPSKARLVRRWKGKQYPLFDRLGELIEGRYATGKYVIHAGAEAASSPVRPGYVGDDDSDIEGSEPSTPVLSAPIPPSFSNAIASSSSNQLPPSSSQLGKRRAATPDDSTDSKKTRARKTAHAALDGMSAAIRDLAKSLNQPAGTGSSAGPSPFDDPQSRLQSAIRMMEKLPLAREDPTGFNRVVMYFVGHPDAVAAYFAFENDEFRQSYLEYILNNHI